MTGALLSLSPDDCPICQRLAELTRLRMMQLSGRRTARSPDESAVEQPNQDQYDANWPAAEREQSG